MAFEDPFFIVKDEVLRALLKTRELYESWRHASDEDLRPLEEQECSTTELRNSLRSIEWDLEDLEDTIQIVERNPSKFRVDTTELAVRKAFIQQTRNEVNLMKAGKSLSATITSHTATTSQGNPEFLLDSASPTTPTAYSMQSSHGDSAKRGGLLQDRGGPKYSRLASDSPSHSQHYNGNNSISNSHYNNGTFCHQDAEQDHLVAQQDCRLNIMSDSIDSFRDVSGRIGVELDEQAVMLDEFGTEVENADSKLDSTMRKMAKVLNLANDRRQWMAFGALSSAMIVIIIIIFAL